MMPIERSSNSKRLQIWLRGHKLASCISNSQYTTSKLMHLTISLKLLCSSASSDLEMNKITHYLHLDTKHAY